MPLTEQQARVRTHMQRAYALLVKAINDSLGAIDETSHAMSYMEAAMYQCRDALSHFNRAAQAFNKARAKKRCAYRERCGKLYNAEACDNDFRECYRSQIDPNADGVHEPVDHVTPPEPWPTPAPRARPEPKPRPMHNDDSPSDAERTPVGSTDSGDPEPRKD